MERNTDNGQYPYVTDIEKDALDNRNYRTTIWTGMNLQVTLMSIPVKSDIGLEIHDDVDQFLRIEGGYGLVQMGMSRDNLRYQRKVKSGYAIFIPHGTWHNVINIGEKPIKLYSIYAPPNHPSGTIHRTKAEAEADEMGY